MTMTSAMSKGRVRKGTPLSSFLSRDETSKYGVSQVNLHHYLTEIVARLEDLEEFVLMVRQAAARDFEKGAVQIQEPTPAVVDEEET